MRHTIRFIILIFALVIAGAGNAWAISESDIIINVQPNSDAGEVSVAVSGMDVTLTVTPVSGYSIDANHIIAEKMVDAMAPRRAPGMASSLPISGSNPFTFTIPDGYTGAYVTVYFYKTTPNGISSLVDIPNTPEGLAGNYVLTADINAAGFESLGNFTGTLDGGFHKIIGLSAPLFTTVSGGTIKNVILEDVKISQAGPVGAIAGTASGYSRIYNCGILPINNKYDANTELSYVQSTDGYCGGLVGWLKDDSRVINCFSYANVTGGTDIAGIVGHNEIASTTAVTDGKYANLRTAVVNCMFYGNLSGGTNTYPVYGGAKMLNNTDTGINSYDFYRSEASVGTLTDYNCSWPAEEKFLTQYEFHRNLLNSNRELCGWWVGAPTAPSTMSTADVQAVPKNASLMAKWVLDPSIAPYPILKPTGYYPSPVNQAPRPEETNPQRIDPDTKRWVSRAPSTNTEMKNPNDAPETDGRSLGKITVTIKKNSGDDGTDKDIIITAMDVDNNDFCYGKIQLPYYNSVYGDPTVQIDPTATAAQKAAQWNSRYGGNYGDNVVVGWEITDITGGTAGTLTKDWQTGYNFADRNCTDKDKERVFAQGGYYYVPYGVSAITITAKWATAIYLDNGSNHSYDRVNFAKMDGSTSGIHFAPAGARPSKLSNGKTVITGNIKDMLPDGSSVYDNAIVLVGNHQYRVGGSDIGNDTKACTIMSADFDLDDEPDYTLIWQLGQDFVRKSFCPIRFDFIPVTELGLAMKLDGSTQYFSLGSYRPLGHFEVTETALIHFGQFEFSNKERTIYAPLILNGGIYDQYTKGHQSYAFKTADDYIDYVIVGGNVKMPSFTPGAHVNTSASFPTRHCAVNVIGGSIDNLYLTGNYNNGVTPNTDNPHCYIDGGKFKQIAAAGKEGIDGDVFFNINHSIINEFYGGSTLADKLVTGNINVTINNSYVTKYCGGPKFGNMSLSDSNPENNKTVKTDAKGTTFGVYYGGGNGGTSYVQYDSRDNTVSATNYNWTGTGTNQGALNSYSPGTYRNKATGYQADYEMEIVNVSTGTKVGQAVHRTYFYAAQFSATNTGSITNNLTDCKVLTNFYGGGNLGGVKGDVTSKLMGSTRVDGSVFGAGYSASIPEVKIYNKDKTYPTINVNTGIITPTPEGSGTSTTYTWTNKTSLGGNTLSTSNPKAMNVEGVNYLYTEESLDNLGSVSGTVTLNVEGTTTVAGSVYGGGEESGVDGSTEVTITGGTIGSEGNGGVEYGNVYGGGKGKRDDVLAGLVKGNTKVTIQNTKVDANTTIVPTIYHNVYGGGAYGSVGDFVYNASGVPTGLIANTTGGKTEVYIKGGTFGWNGKENGMVFGSSRGDVGEPNGITDKQAWVYDTEVVIGTANSESNATPHIKGSVYGGGENGHNYHDAKVTMYSGTIGITDTQTDGGARYPYRGNVYGGGCGTDTYEIDHDDDDSTPAKIYFNRLAGIVRGNTEVNITGGHVVHNVYGGGAMGSVGLFTREASDDIHMPGKITSVTSNTGKCTVTVSGGTVGNTGAKMINETGGPDDFGHVFGAGRGEVQALADYPNLERVIYVDNTDVTISGGLVTGSVYGGSESGHVLGNTVVKIQGGQIGCGVGQTVAYTDTDWSATSLNPTAHWTYSGDHSPYDQYASTAGKYDYTNFTNIPEADRRSTSEGGRPTATDGHTFFGNVFGGGSGYYPYAPGYWLRSAGQVGGTATVTISGGHILNNVYGGCEMADIEGAVTVTMTGGTVGVPRTKAEIEALPTLGHIYGAGMGDKRIFFNTSTNVAQTTVSVSGGTVYGSVYGGGEDGHVLGNTTTTISQAANKTTVIGCDGKSGYDGNVFGGGQGSVTAKTAGVVAGDVVVNIEGGTMKGSVYGGGRLASVGTYFAMANHANYGKMQADVEDDTSTTEVNEAESHGHIKVNLTGGTIHQNVYGGCMGTTDAGDDSEDYGVSKTVEVNLNKPQCEGKDADNIGTASGCAVKGDIFGCNNTNASPQQTVTVHVYGTQNAAKNDIVTKFFKATADLDNIGTLSTIKESIASLNAASENAKTEQETAYDTNLANYNKEGATDAEKQTALANIKKIILFATADELGLDISTDKATLDDTEATATQKQTALENIKKAINDSKYDVHAVYGGGNLAAYTPIGPNPTTTSDDGQNTTYSTNVIIDGCGLTSIQYVYGGGNAASTPATNVTVNGTFEIEEVFGGGNGKDNVVKDDVIKPNPGANVGYKDYSEYYQENNVWKVKDKSDADTKEKRLGSAYEYGTGRASVNIFGGTIHRVFGGSNTKGNVRKTAVTMLEEAGGCDFCVDEAYGGGKSAPMDAEARLHMACIPGLQAAYGGAEAAAIQGNVTLNITNGTFDRVFGGNNLSGTIKGSITVNIEEVGCKPIKIGELYGGGNQAGYSVYGYDSKDKPIEKGDDPLYDDPQVNVKSFTSIGNIYGGGFGTGATMVGNPTVNINEAYGRYYNDDSSEVGDNAETPNHYPIPSHAKGKIGAINNVFGGGNAAKVIGNTAVNIAIIEEVYVVKEVAAGASVIGYYTRSGKGTTADPFVYTALTTGTAVDGTTYYEKKDVIGADIRGNVYGGGNNAEVTGNTNVVIGKKETTTTP